MAKMFKVNLNKKKGRQNEYPFKPLKYQLKYSSNK